MIPFWKITPGGNPTVLLRAEDVPPALRADAAAELMSDQHLGCEQVGFISPGEPDGELPRLDMMGGEFCLNATRAFAALLARRGRLSPAPGRRGLPSALAGTVSVSGAETPVAVTVTPAPSSSPNPDRCTASATLDLAVPPRPETLDDGTTLVRLPGIVHLILCGGRAGTPPAPEDLEETCADLRHRHDLEHEEAVGCLWLDTDGPTPVMLPAVWVRATRTLCRESACGSGTLACALFLARRDGRRRADILQPSGSCLTVHQEEAPDGGILFRVEGPVNFVAEGNLALTTL